MEIERYGMFPINEHDYLAVAFIRDINGCKFVRFRATYPSHTIDLSVEEAEKLSDFLKYVNQS